MSCLAEFLYLLLPKDSPTAEIFPPTSSETGNCLKDSQDHFVLKRKAPQPLATGSPSRCSQHQWAAVLPPAPSTWVQLTLSECELFSVLPLAAEHCSGEHLLFGAVVVAPVTVDMSWDMLSQQFQWEAGKTNETRNSFSICNKSLNFSTFSTLFLVTYSK